MRPCQASALAGLEQASWSSRVAVGRICSMQNTSELIGVAFMAHENKLCAETLEAYCRDELDPNVLSGPLGKTNVVLGRR